MITDIKVKDLEQKYDNEFIPSKEYLASMPDLQNTVIPELAIPINMVGISNFHLPLMIAEKQTKISAYKRYQEVRATICGTVSLEAEKAGINMSRIIRTFTKECDGTFSIDSLCDILKAYKRDLDSFDAHITIEFPFHMWQDSLRSRNDDGELNGGYLYYDVVFDVDIDRDGKITKRMSLDYTYSSACPCSTALTMHNMYQRGKFGIPHSQRSVARIWLEFEDRVWIEDLIKACQEAMVTEVQALVKREDEQAFSELNGANPNFVEDAVRKFASACDTLNVKDYKIICSHNESLHAHNAIAILTKGVPGGFTQDTSVEELRSLLK